MVSSSRSRFLSVALIGIVLLPAMRHLNEPAGRRSGRRHASHSCSLRPCHSAAVRQARALRRRERRARRLEELRRIQEALTADGARRSEPRAQTPPEPDSGASLAQSLPSAGDLGEDESDFLKRKKRRGQAATRWWLLDQRPRAPADGELVAMQRVRVEDRAARLRHETQPLPHFGSGPCHSIPRPREGTVVTDLASGRAVA